MVEFREFICGESNQRKAVDYVKSPFRYPGGKYYALKYLLPFINCVPHDEYREPFVGGGSIFFAKKKAPINWINDLETDIISTYKVIADKDLCDVFCSLLEIELATRERHNEIKGMNPRSLLEIAFKTYYLNRTSYSGIIHKPAWGYVEGKSSPPRNWPSFILPASRKLHKVNITNYDFEEVIEQKGLGANVLLYLDPPYFHADQKRAYIKSFCHQDHVRLAQVLKKSSFNFCLSYDDCPEIRSLYSWAIIHKIGWLYNTANLSGQKRSYGSELVITNYEVIKSRQVIIPLN